MHIQTDPQHRTGYWLHSDDHHFGGDQSPLNDSDADEEDCEPISDLDLGDLGLDEFSDSDKLDIGSATLG